MPFTSKPFPDQSVLTSSAQTPDTLAVIFQPLIAQVLGFNPQTDPPDQVYSAVRVDWQKLGQPSWDVNQDIVAIGFTPESQAMTAWRDGYYSPNDAISQTSNQSFTQVWKLQGTCYGPNGYNNARLILDAFSLDWTHDTLAALGIYAIVGWDRPRYVPEFFQGQWYKRTDFTVLWNELVLESISVPSAAGVDVDLVTDIGFEEQFQIRVPN